MKNLIVCQSEECDYSSSPSDTHAHEKVLTQPPVVCFFPHHRARERKGTTRVRSDTGTEWQEKRNERQKREIEKVQSEI